MGKARSDKSAGYIKTSYVYDDLDCILQIALWANKIKTFI